MAPLSLTAAGKESRQVYARLLINFICSLQKAARG